MIPAPLGFFVVKKEVFGADAPEFGERELGETPEALDAVDGSPTRQPPLFPSASSVILAAGELVLVMMNTVVFVAFEH